MMVNLFFISEAHPSVSHITSLFTVHDKFGASFRSTETITHCATSPVFGLNKKNVISMIEASHDEFEFWLTS